MNGQRILPAVRSMKDFDRLLKMNYEYGVFLDIHIGMLKSVYTYANEHGKKMFLHVDLIQGLKSDEYATEFLCQLVKPYGLISTKSSVITKAKQKGVVAIQRTFIIDSNAFERSVQLVEKTNPDYIEVLPGVVPKVISQLHERTGKEIIAGGLIENETEVEAAIAAGAVAVTTSNVELWRYFEPK
ncbi:glycerol-3-phosphate responsive antiterminator [Anoxybacillus sp. LAT_35]|uniref:glycerol-3-phosphate responsive antiterminator n=1 Tax=Anoxybacillus TaxID=150247 RepID=UPI001EDC4D57|nr:MULTISPECIES: glycerol-3-phosphate responsive antiterminator [Anoxybacillus]MCG5025143.1 glycerol-3-phosphate responsive antiterminator [Anoxybacillus flavithermus]MCG6195892.1 glycerol-3-phosphate responsive antiterminator [Anoxybacillus sp. LAT_38]MCG3082934.1 glycerol-3-phosphate responsive antiterminator [Anoxybacillus sp. LAT27]MCG3083520.1 glycerol-3-phosphate responsive antiterminator [Anoxybacillus sp. LAT27]MCG6170377.1 glycerol-3-phosphate responsive antiterminator [Anoxybacillus 